MGGFGGAVLVLEEVSRLRGDPRRGDGHRGVVVVAHRDRNGASAHAIHVRRTGEQDVDVAIVLVVVHRPEPHPPRACRRVDSERQRAIAAHEVVAVGIGSGDRYREAGRHRHADTGGHGRGLSLHKRVGGHGQRQGRTVVGFRARRVGERAGAFVVHGPHVHEVIGVGHQRAQRGRRAGLAREPDPVLHAGAVFDVIARYGRARGRGFGPGHAECADDPHWHDDGRQGDLFGRLVHVVQDDPDRYTAPAPKAIIGEQGHGVLWLGLVVVVDGAQGREMASSIHRERPRVGTLKAELERVAVGIGHSGTAQLVPDAGILRKGLGSARRVEPGSVVAPALDPDLVGLVRHCIR